MKSIVFNNSSNKNQNNIENLFSNNILDKDALRSIKGGTEGGEDDYGEEDAIIYPE